MHAPERRRTAATPAFRLLSVVALALASIRANAVIVRGTVTDPLGAAIPGAHVSLIQGKTNAGSAITGPDGSFEIRSTASGRFVLLSSAATFTANISQNFYGGRTDLITRNPTLEIASIVTQVTVTATGIPTPIQQTSSAITLIPFSALQERVGVMDAVWRHRLYLRSRRKLRCQQGHDRRSHL
jgi:iron complex outermembrane receptor protein/vitamin B12 transporter